MFLARAKILCIAAFDSKPKRFSKPASKKADIFKLW